MTSPLYRILKDAPKPLISMSANRLPFSDSQIAEISAHHGGPDAGGYEPSTLSFKFRGLAQVGHDSECTWRLTPEFAQWVHQRTGRAPNVIRFTGRIGKSMIDDRGDVAAKTTSVNASSWGTLLRSARRALIAPAGNALSTVLVAALSHPALGWRVPLSTGPIADFDTVRVGQADKRFDDIMDHWGRDRGILCRQLMNGTVEVRPLSYHAKSLAAAAANSPAILRAQTLAPTTWEQPMDTHGATLYIKRRKEDDSQDVTRQWPTLPMASRIALDTEVVDWTDTNIRTDNVSYAMSAQAFRMNYPRTSVTEIQVDIARLLASKRAYDRMVAGHLLSLDPYQPIFLGGDWPATVRGPMIATEISESMTADEWRLTISLDTPRRQLGIYDTGLPAIPPRVWAQYTSETWTDEKRTWQEAK